MGRKNEKNEKFACLLGLFVETERLYDSMGFPFGFIQDNGANKTVYVNGYGPVACYVYGSRQTFLSGKGAELTGQSVMYGDKCEYIANLVYENGKK